MNNELWFGTEKSYYDLQAALARSPEMTQLRLGESDEDETTMPVELIDGVAIISINGPLISTATWFSQWLGIPSYDGIKETLSELAGETKVRAILLDYDTPGGQAKGCKSCANFIREYAENVKPVISYTAGSAASAGMWLYSAGLAHFMDEDAQVGSVGAIMVHSEYTEMDRQMGVTRKVFRSAPYKALGTPFEKLSKEAEAEITEELDFLHQQFVSGISELSDIPEATVAKKIATGKMFRSDKALSLGLTDQVLSFGEVIAKLSEQYRAKPSSKR